MVRQIFIFGGIFFCFTLQKVAAQVEEPATIKVKRESNLAKVVLDNTENKLIVVDRFGNPRENKIVSYQLYIKSTKDTKQFSGYSNSLTTEMIKTLNSYSGAVKIFITEITVIDEHERPQKLPDLIETWFPDCKNCEPTKKRRR